MNYNPYIEISNAKKFPKRVITLTKLEQKYVDDIVAGKPSKESLALLDTLVFSRSRSSSTYSVSIVLPVMELMFDRKRYLHKDVNRFELDTELFKLVWSQIYLTRLFRLLNTYLLRDFTRIVWSYLCPGANADANDTSVGSTRYYFIEGYELNCCKYVHDLDYLNQNYNIVKSSFDLSLFQSPQQLINSSKKLTTLKNKVKVLKCTEKLLENSQRAKRLKYSNEITNLDKTAQLLRKGIYDQVHYEWLVKEYYKSCYAESYRENKLNEAYASISQWLVQACSHVDSHKDCWPKCYKLCDSEYCRIVEKHHQLYRKQCDDQDIATESRQYSTGINLNNHQYSIVWTHKSSAPVQINLETKRTRYLARQEGNLYKDLTINYATGEDLTRIFDCISPGLMNGVDDNNDNINFTISPIFKDKDSSYERITQLFLDSKNELSQSMRDHFDLSKDPKALIFERIEVCHNSKLAEAFALQRKNSENNFCLLGFHGSNSPFDIMSSGLDPRFSNRGSLGYGSYISTTAHYCHCGGYSHQLGIDNVDVNPNPNSNSNLNDHVNAEANVETEAKYKHYEVFLVCFLPGKTYFEYKPNSHGASERRIAPKGFTSVCGISNNTRIWAMYERCDVYPLYRIIYKVKI